MAIQFFGVKSYPMKKMKKKCSRFCGLKFFFFVELFFCEKLLYCEVIKKVAAVELKKNDLHFISKKILIFVLQRN